MVVAGEASGDLHGATLCRALRTVAPGCQLVGMGGQRMAASGLHLLADVTSSAVVGTTEAVSRLPVLCRAYRQLRAALEAGPRPAVLVLIDFPEFNLRLARVARRAGVPVVYFVPPQIWAWRGGRIRTIRRVVSLVLAVLPFEAALYRQAGVRVEFVGHPVLDALADAPGREEARAGLGLAATGEPVIGLLPGSRREEVARTLPPMAEAARRLAERWPAARFVLARAATVERGAIAALLGPAPPVLLVDDRSHAVMRAADVLLVASGTAALEAALLGTPMVAGYRVSRTTELTARLLIRIPWITLPNITLGRAVVPELIGGALTGEGLAAEAAQLLANPGAGEAQRAAFAELSRQLGAPGVGARAARLVLSVAGMAA
jgi:lipid-A-disaccharide synthase